MEESSAVPSTDSEAVITVQNTVDVPDAETKEKQLSRSARKRQFYEERMKKKKESRKQRKLALKTKPQQTSSELQAQNEDGMNKKERREKIRERLVQAVTGGQKICIDCSLGEFMSDKEKGKLAMQIGRLYGSNRKADNPVHLYLTGLEREGTLYQEFVRKNDGFANYVMNVEEKSHSELFPLDNIVYLSPDADKALTDLDPDTVYVIGGLVDESISKNISKSKADTSGIQTARLPIDEYMLKCEQPSYSTVLSVNQVFDILLTYLSTKSWRSALAVGVPKRKGYVLKPETDTSELPS